MGELGYYRIEVWRISVFNWRLLRDGRFFSVQCVYWRLSILPVSVTSSSSHGGAKREFLVFRSFDYNSVCTETDRQTDRQTDTDRYIDRQRRRQRQRDRQTKDREFRSGDYNSVCRERVTVGFDYNLITI